MSEAGVAGPAFDLGSIGGARIFDQLHLVPIALDLADEHAGARNRSDGLDQFGVSWADWMRSEAQRLSEVGHRALEIGDGEAGMVHALDPCHFSHPARKRSEEHTSELQSL